MDQMVNSIVVRASVRNRVKLFFTLRGGGGRGKGSLSETFSWAQQRPSTRPIIIILL